MDFSDVVVRQKRKRQILFRKESPCLHNLMNLIRSSDHRALVLWALECAEETLCEVEERLPGELRPRICLEQCDAWSQGLIKMPQAKRSILACHAVAGTTDPITGALCHAIGHAGATVHTGGHAIGLPMYELTALALNHQGSGYESEAERKIQWYEERLRYWQTHWKEAGRPWAAFLEKPDPEASGTESFIEPKSKQP